MNLGEARIALRLLLHEVFDDSRVAEEMTAAMEGIALAVVAERLARMGDQIERFISLLQQVRDPPADIDLRCNTSRRQIGLAAPPLCILCQAGPCRLHSEHREH